MLEGQFFTNSQGLEFKVLKLSKKDKSYKKYYDVLFVDSGYIAKDIRSDTIRSGLVRDKLQASFCSVGRIGNANTRQNWKEYKLWSGMVSRCYRKEDIGYKYYGEKGVTVCDRWLTFSNFLQDMKKITGYDKELFKQGCLRLDKDIKHDGDIKIYSLYNCCFVSDLANQKQRTKEYNKRNKKIAIHPDGTEELILNVTDFCKKHSLQRQNVRLCLIGENSQHKGFKFRHED